LSNHYTGHLLQQYLEEYPHSKILERKNSFLSFCDHFNHLHIDEVTTDSLKKWFNHIKDKNKYTNRTLDAIKIMINHFFKYLEKEGVIAHNPLLKIKFRYRNLPKSRPRTVLTIDEIKEMLDNLKDHSPNVLYPFIYALCHTGARKSEIRLLRWAQVDFNAEFIHLIKTKNGEERRIKLSPGLKQLLMDLKPKRVHLSDYLFLNQWNYLLSVGQVRDTIISMQKKYPNQKKWRCHDLRHSFAYNFLKKGGEMYALKAILGHRSIQMTVDLYGQLKASDVPEVSPYNF
jgi:integrase